MNRFLLISTIAMMGCSNPRSTPLDLAVAFQKAVESKDYEKAYKFIDDGIQQHTIPEDLELFFRDEESVLKVKASGSLVPVVPDWPNYRIVEFEESHPKDSCGVTDIIVVKKNKNDVWSVVWVDHLSKSISLAPYEVSRSLVNPLSTRNRFYFPSSYANYGKSPFAKLERLIPNERFVRRQGFNDLKSLELWHSYPISFPFRRKSERLIHQLINEDTLKYVFNLHNRRRVELAIELFDECTEFSIPDIALIALAQYQLLVKKEAIWEGEPFLKDHWNGGNVRGFIKNLRSIPSRQFWTANEYIEAHEKLVTFIDAIRQDLKSGQYDSLDVIKAAKLLSMVRDKSNPEYIATLALTRDAISSAQMKNTRSLTSSELQVCEKSFAAMREFYPPFELYEFCNCVFHSSAGFETFLESPARYLRENSDCMERYLFGPSDMNETEIASYWSGVEKGSQPITRDGFSISCARGLMTLPEFDEDYDTAREFCNCIYDEADDKSLAMEDLLTSAGKDISEACRHIVYP